MKIITPPHAVNTPPHAVKPVTRDEWIASFYAAFPDSAVTETPTGYRDMGAAVRFLFRATGAEAEWYWERVSASTAASEALAAHLTPSFS